MATKSARSEVPQMPADCSEHGADDALVEIAGKYRVLCQRHVGRGPGNRQMRKQHPGTCQQEGFQRLSAKTYAISESH